MKELTIEQKAKAYDEAIKIAKETYNTQPMYRNWLESMFPELEKSEDERIRKGIKSILEHYKENGEVVCPYPFVSINEALTWLENQGEQKSDTDFSDFRTWKYIVDAVLTEKEGVGQYLDNPLTEEVAKKLQKRFGNIKQKYIDKIEPKFKQGEWIVWQDKCYKVNYNGCGYELVDQNGLSTSLEYRTVDENAHLWTIEDAKDGDVLYDNYTNTVLIFKSQTCGWIKVYCDFWINKNKFTGTDHADYGRVSEMNLKLATKEQRDLLFKKMKEAGYSFDFETKELKKDEIKIKAGRNYRCTMTHMYAGLDWFEGTKYYADEDYSLVNNGCTCFCPKYSKYEHNNLFEEVEYDDYVEKQGGQKPDIEMKTPEESLGVDSDTYNKIVDECIYGEPKFKVGNWYQCTKDFFGKGVTFDKNTAYYCAKEGCLQNEYGCHIAIVEDLYNNFKLWTIKDARDGDVLVYDGEIFMIKSYTLWNKIVYHCCYDGKILHKHSIYGSWRREDFDKVHPATKEQRDLLFQKMEEAGYEWDEAKKELKKIEQNPYPKTLDKAIELYYYSYGNGKGGFNNLSFEKFRDIVKTFVEDYGDKSTWSEEDEDYRFDVNVAIDDLYDEGYAEKLRGWLKLLKERMQPQPKQE